MKIDKLTQEEIEYLNLIDKKIKINDWMSEWNPELNRNLAKNGYIDIVFQKAQNLPGDVDVAYVMLTNKFNKIKNENKINYVLGFMFNNKKDEVLLIRKTKPDWQKNKLNGIGGKIESFDKDEFDSQSREFFEETDIKTKSKEWIKFCTLNLSNDCYVYCFKLTSNEKRLKNLSPKKTTEETPEIVDVSSIRDRNDVLPNLKWMIPLALDSELRHCEINYKK